METLSDEDLKRVRKKATECMRAVDSTLSLLASSGALTGARLAEFIQNESLCAELGISPAVRVCLVLPACVYFAIPRRTSVPSDVERTSEEALLLFTDRFCKDVSKFEPDAVFIVCAALADTAKFRNPTLGGPSIDGFFEGILHDDALDEAVLPHPFRWRIRKWNWGNFAYLPWKPSYPSDLNQNWLTRTFWIVGTILFAAGGTWFVYDWRNELTALVISATLFALAVATVFRWMRAERAEKWGIDLFWFSKYRGY